MTYNNTMGVHMDSYDRFIIKLVLIMVGGLIGASLGLYVAVRTMPLPVTDNYYYLQGRP